MTLIRPDGTEGGTHDLRPGENKLGRSFGPVFENDGYLSPVHALLDIRGQQRDRARSRQPQRRVREDDAGRGAAVAARSSASARSCSASSSSPTPEPTADGTELMGSPNPGFWGKLTVIIGREVTGAAFPLLGESFTLGRERGEINFPDDGYVSGLHARVTLRDGRVFLADLGSSNGTFIKVNGERAVGHDSFVLLGQQLFRLNFSLAAPRRRRARTAASALLLDLAWCRGRLTDGPVVVLLDEREAVRDLQLAARLEDDEHVDLLVRLAAGRLDDQLAVAREPDDRALARAEVDLRVARRRRR